MSRIFHITQECTETYQITWEVEAESFEDAEEQLSCGMAEEYDRDSWPDTDYGYVDSITCQDCFEDDPDSCECERVDHEFMAEIGL